MLLALVYLLNTEVGIACEPRGAGMAEAPSIPYVTRGYRALKANS